MKRGVTLVELLAAIALLALLMLGAASWIRQTGDVAEIVRESGAGTSGGLAATIRWIREDLWGGDHPAAEDPLHPTWRIERASGDQSLWIQVRQQPDHSTWCRYRRDPADRTLQRVTASGREVLMEDVGSFRCQRAEDGPFLLVELEQGGRPWQGRIPLP